ncbi:MAG: NAD-binding protein, partial [Cyanobacteria bacterium J06639_1]
MSHSSPPTSASSAAETAIGSDRFIVCGLGSLGQNCVANLRAFGVDVTAVDLVLPSTWELPDLPGLLAEAIEGDCCQGSVLERAGARQARAILLVTESDRVNVAAAFAARLLNPNIRLVLRLSQQNLHSLLATQIGNLVALEPMQLSASAFALAALGDDVLAVFKLGDRLLQVVQRQLDPEDPWCRRDRLSELNSRTRCLLVRQSGTHPSISETPFYEWQPDDRPVPGDRVVYLELVTQSPRWSAGEREEPPEIRWQQYVSVNFWRQWWERRWRSWVQHPIQRVAIACGLTVVMLLALGTLLYRVWLPESSLPSAFFATAILLLGGYGDLFGEWQATTTLPWWLRSFGLMLTLAGTALVGVLYALLTEKVLSARLQFLKQRPPVPHRDHVILVGMGRVGQRTATALQEFRQPCVAISQNGLERDLLPQLPAIAGEYVAALDRAHLDQAKSVALVTDNELVNLEVGLMAREANPQVHLVIRTVEPRFTTNLARLFPDAQVLNAYELAAEAFAGAAFGENILHLFRLGDRTVLVTEYDISTGDTLVGRLLAEVAQGYGIVPVLYQRPNQPEAIFPADETILHPGDRLIVLATTAGLKRVEQGIVTPKRWHILVEGAGSEDAAFEGANAIARLT